MINKETILSNYDNKLTLLQWLKQVQGQLKDLKENGVPANTPVYTAKEFDEKYKNANGEYVNCIVQLESEYLNDSIYLNGQLYAGNNIPAWAGSGYTYFIFGIYADYVYFKEDMYGEGSLHIGYLWTFNDELNELVEESEFQYGGKLFTQDDVDNEIYRKIRTDVYDYTNWGGLYKELLDRSNLHKFVYQQKKTCYGTCGVNLARDMAIGMFKYNPNIHVYNFNGILIKNNGEIFYSNGEGQLDSTSGVLSNAVSGTQLKEAVRLATQKTYWHTINLHNSGTLSDVHITIVIPSHSNNPVANDQDLLAIGAGDTWGCSGTIATTESALPIVTFDGVKFGATAEATIFSGTLGRTYTLTQLIAKGLEYSDNVKEVK